MKNNNKNGLKKKTRILGIAALATLAGLTLTGCSRQLREAQTNIDTSVTAVLNESEYIDDILNSKVTNFEFLCADVADAKNQQYSVDINGLASAENNTKAYTTLSYVVGANYFAELDQEKDADLINALASIVQNENLKSISAEKVNDVSALNSAISNCIESPLDGFHVNKNFLYSVGNVQFDDENKVVSFATKEATKFSKTTVETHYGVVAYFDDGPQYGLVTTTHTEYETFFIDHNVYIRLTQEEYEQAKKDHSFAFDKFVSMVKNEEKENYVFQETNIQKDKPFSANMMDEVSLGK